MYDCQISCAVAVIYSTMIFGCGGVGGGGGESANVIPEDGESLSGNVDGIRNDVYRPVGGVGGNGIIDVTC